MVRSMAQYDSIYFPKRKFSIDEDPCPDCGGENCVEIIRQGEYACKKCGEVWSVPDETTNPLEVWQVIRCSTNNGVRIGIIQEVAHDPDESVLATVYGQDTADKKAKEISTQLGIPEFNNDVDVWLE